ETFGWARGECPPRAPLSNRCFSGSLNERSRSASALSLLAGPSPGRDPVQAMDRDGHSGHRPADLRGAVYPPHPRLPFPPHPGRQAAESGFVVLGMALVIVVGGIDLSVGSIFALTDFCALFCLDVLDLPVPAVVVVTIAFGALLGAVNGFLIGYLRLRAFITT